MKKHEGEFAVRLMCRVLSVSPSGYYGWRNRKPSRRDQAREALDVQVRERFEDRKGREGAPRLSRRLGRCRCQVAQSLRRQGLRAKAARKFKATTNANHALPVAENRLQQDFTAQRQNQAWVCDITYIGTDEGWLYLAAVLGQFSRKIVGWSMSDRMTAALVCDALRMALFNRKLPRGVIVHSDPFGQARAGSSPLPARSASAAQLILRRAVRPLPASPGTRSLPGRRWVAVDSSPRRPRR